MKGHNFHHKTVTGLALVPTTINSGGTATITGATIVEPQQVGRQISFILIGGAFASSSSVTVVVQGQKRSDSLWETVKDKGGSVDLQFTATLMDDAQQLEAGRILGTVPLNYWKADTYKAIRLLATADAAADALVGAVYIISDLYKEVSGMTDDLFDKLFVTPT